MGRNSLNKTVNPDDKIGIQFPFIGSDYIAISDYIRTVIDKETGKPITLTKFLGGLVKKTAASIRAGKRIKV
jgi:hypothetical protein